MKFQKFCLQEKIQQNHGLVNGFSINYAKRFSQQHGVQERPCQTGVFEKSTDNIDRTNSSSTIMSHIGSPGSAFFATEIYMGLPYYDSQDNHPSLCPEISKNFDDQIPCFQQSVADNSYVDQLSLEQANTIFPPLQPAAESSSCIDNLYNSTVSEKSYPERDLIMQLKRKLLEDNYDTPDKRRSIVACDGDSCLNAQNLYGYQVANVAQSAGTSGNDVVSSDSAITSCKTRIRWSQELHDRFVECVNRLGGSEKATPKAILRLMESDVLTIYHVKSHLQKYRITKYIPDSAKGKSEKKTSTNDVEQTGTKTGMQLKEAMKLQIAVQKRLYEQLEIQKHLQLRIEEQANQLKQMFDLHQQKTNSVNETQQSSSEPPPDESLIAESNGTPQRPLEID